MGIYDSTSDKSNSEYTSRQLSTLSTKSTPPEWPHSGSSDLHKDLTGVFNTIFDSTPLNGLLGESFEDSWTNLKHFRRDNVFQDFLNGAGCGKLGLVSALKAYPVPNTYVYEKCKANEGLSVWDEHGWWRCLFPSGKLTKKNEVSKEDVEDDKENKLGLFFKDYSGLLDWKIQVRKMIKEKEEKERLQRQQENIQSIYDQYAKDTPGASKDEDDKKVISTSKSSYFTTLENGDFEEIIETNKVFANGDSKHDKVKKIYPKGGGEVIVENLGSRDGKGKGLSTWIWGDEKK